MTQDHSTDNGTQNPQQDISTDAEGKLDSSSAPTELETLKTALTQSQQEASQYQDRYLRVLADMENLRKRSQREKEDAMKFGMESFFRDILPVLDSVEKAIVAKSQSVEDFHNGMKLVQRQLTDLLERNGLSAVEALQKKFNPEFHQALTRIESPEVEHEEVHEEYARGYLLHGRLLRPAMVSVRVPAQ
jgi:molecular chaperone GrpE